MNEKETLLNLINELDDYAIKFLVTFVKHMFIH